MLEVIYLILMILFLFGITIFVHEWGHFIVARKCGLKVEAFAIGMVPSIWQKEIDDVMAKEDKIRLFAAFVDNKMVAGVINFIVNEHVILAFYISFIRKLIIQHLKKFILTYLYLYKISRVTTNCFTFIFY